MRALYSYIPLVFFLHYVFYKETMSTTHNKSVNCRNQTYVPVKISVTISPVSSTAIIKQVSKWIWHIRVCSKGRVKSEFSPYCSSATIVYFYEDASVHINSWIGLATRLYWNWNQFFVIYYFDHCSLHTFWI